MLMNTSQLVTRATLHNSLGVKLAHWSVRSADTQTRNPRNCNDGQLGVTIDKNLKFSSRVSTSSCKANIRASSDSSVCLSVDTLIRANCTDSQLITQTLKQNGQLVTWPWKQHSTRHWKIAMWQVDWIPCWWHTIQSNPMSITEAGQRPLFPSLSKNLKYKNTNIL